MATYNRQSWVIKQAKVKRLCLGLQSFMELSLSIFQFLRTLSPPNTKSTLPPQFHALACFPQGWKIKHPKSSSGPPHSHPLIATYPLLMFHHLFPTHYNPSSSLPQSNQVELFHVKYESSKRPRQVLHPHPSFLQVQISAAESNFGLRNW